MADVEIRMTDFEKGMCLLGLGKIDTDLDFRRPGANSEALAWNTFIRLKLNYPQPVMPALRQLFLPALSRLIVGPANRNPQHVCVSGKGADRFVEAPINLQVM
jgi:hypothetical protein